MQGEGALHPDAEADLADGEGLADAPALTADDDALEDLHARAGAFDDLDVDLDGVACAELRDVVTEARCVEGVQNVHEVPSWSVPQATGRPGCPVVLRMSYEHVVGGGPGGRLARASPAPPVAGATATWEVCHSARR